MMVKDSVLAVIMKGFGLEQKGMTPENPCQMRTTADALNVGPDLTMSVTGLCVTDKDAKLPGTNIPILRFQTPALCFPTGATAADESNQT